MRISTAIPALLVLALATTLVANAAELTPPPVWQSGTLIGPARSAAQFAKATFTYNTTTKALVFKLGSKSVQMKLGATAATANGKSSTLPVAPKSVNGTTFVPLKVLFEGLGLQVHPSGTDAWIVCTDQICLRLKVPPKPK